MRARQLCVPQCAGCGCSTGPEHSFALATTAQASTVAMHSCGARAAQFRLEAFKASSQHIRCLQISPNAPQKRVRFDGTASAGDSLAKQRGRRSTYDAGLHTEEPSRPTLPALLCILPSSMSSSAGLAESA